MSSSAAPVALVTGGSRGIGRAIAVMLARRGYALRLVGRSTDQLRTTLDLCSPVDGGEHRKIVADLSDATATAGVAEEVISRDGTLSLLVLNAGIATSASVEHTSLADWDRIFAVNVRSPFVLAQACIPMLRRSSGRIVAIGSVVSKKAYPNQGAYAASKHALYGLTKVLAQELHDSGVVVQTVLPGGVATDLVRTMRPDIDPRDLIQPEDVANAVSACLDQTGAARTDEISLRRRGKTPFA